MWAERGAAGCCVVWQISVDVKSVITTQQVWLITLWGGGAKWTVAGGNFMLGMILGRKKWKIHLILSLLYILIYRIYIIKYV